MSGFVAFRRCRAFAVALLATALGHICSVGAFAEAPTVTVVGTTDLRAPINYEGGSYWPWGPIVCEDVEFVMTLSFRDGRGQPITDLADLNWSGAFRQWPWTLVTGGEYHWAHVTTDYDIVFDDPACPQLTGTYFGGVLVVSGGGGDPADGTIFSLGTGDFKPVFTVVDTNDPLAPQDLCTSSFEPIMGPLELPWGFRVWNGWSLDFDADDYALVVSGDAAPVDTDGDGVPDDEDVFPNDPNEWADSDSDGVGDNADLNDNSDLRATVVVGGSDTGVANQMVSDGLSIQDRINDIEAAVYRNHGQYVSTVDHFAEALLAAGVITDEEADAIVSSAARSGIGKKKGRK